MIGQWRHSDNSGLTVCVAKQRKAPGRSAKLVSPARSDFNKGGNRRLRQNLNTVPFIKKLTHSDATNRWHTSGCGFCPCGSACGSGLFGGSDFSPNRKKETRFRMKSCLFWSCYPDSNWGPHPYQPTGDLDREYLLIPTDPKKPSDTNGLRVFNY